MSTPLWRRKWDARHIGDHDLLMHGQLVVLIPRGLSESHVRKLFAEAAKVYGYGNKGAKYTLKRLRGDGGER